MKTVLITGSSRGIGRETAIYFAQQGCRENRERYVNLAKKRKNKIF